MQPQPASIDNVDLGSLITVVAQQDGSPMAIPGTLRSYSPLMISIPFEGGIRRGEMVLLLGHNNLSVLKADALVQKISKSGSQWMLTLAADQWESTNRRRAERASVNLPVKLAAIGDAKSELILDRFSGEFLELSQAGGWVKATQVMPPGTLLQWQCSINNAAARGLALVVRASEEESAMALEFVEFSGSAYGVLSSYLLDQAA
ncbi:MAG: hypothetical protein K1X67_22395 [Fimbriimonadaceae bacterium]|nr:hypothetical protein [Fimbriimonadaceae bacterium]